MRSGPIASNYLEPIAPPKPVLWIPLVARLIPYLAVLNRDPIIVDILQQQELEVIGIVGHGDI